MEEKRDKKVYMNEFISYFLKVVKLDELFEKEKFVKINFDGYNCYYYVSFLKDMDYGKRNLFLKDLKYDPVGALGIREIYSLIYGTLIEFQIKNMYDRYDYIVFPDTSHNKLMDIMVSYIEIFLKSSEAKTELIEMKKCNPKSIVFDESIYKEKDKEKADEHLAQVRNLDYFSIAKNGGAFRKYFRNFLEINDVDSIIKLKDATENTKILLFDDINTTGSTLREIIRKLHAINDKLKFDIYTVIGKHR